MCCRLVTSFQSCQFQLFTTVPRTCYSNFPLSWYAFVSKHNCSETHFVTSCSFVHSLSYKVYYSNNKYGVPYSHCSIVSWKQRACLNLSKWREEYCLWATRGETQALPAEKTRDFNKGRNSWRCNNHSDYNLRQTTVSFWDRGNIRIFIIWIFHSLGNIYGVLLSWSVTRKEENALRMFENRVLMRIFETKNDDIIGQWGNLQVPLKRQQTINIPHGKTTMNSLPLEENIYRIWQLPMVYSRGAQFSPNDVILQAQIGTSSGGLSAAVTQHTSVLNLLQFSENKFTNLNSFCQNTKHPYLWRCIPCV